MKKLQSLLSIFIVVFLSFGMSSPKDDQPTTVESKNIDNHSNNYTKPHAGIELDYKFPKALQLGESIELHLKFKTRANADSLHISISHDDGLQLDSEARYQFATKKGSINKIALQLSGLKEGRFFVDISAVITVQGQTQVRSFSIPVTVGDPANFKSSEKKASDAGYTVKPSEGVMSMPATETTE